MRFVIIALFPCLGSSLVGPLCFATRSNQLTKASQVYHTDDEESSTEQIEENPEEDHEYLSCLLQKHVSSET